MHILSYKTIVSEISEKVHAVPTSAMFAKETTNVLMKKKNTLLFGFMSQVL